MKSVCRIFKNSHGPSRFTGNWFPWICETPDGQTYCDTRESARDVARDYNQERKNLLKEGAIYQGKVEFYENGKIV